MWSALPLMTLSGNPATLKVQVRDYRLARVECMLNPNFGTVYATLHCPLVESGFWCPGFRGAGHGDPDQDT